MAKMVSPFQASKSVLFFGRSVLDQDRLPMITLLTLQSFKKTITRRRSARQQGHLDDKEGTRKKESIIIILLRLEMLRKWTS